MLLTAHILILSSLAVLLCVAALGDIRSYRIPNKLNMVIAALAIPYWLIKSGGDYHLLWASIWPEQLLLIAITWSLAIAVLLLGFFGGGDCKLVAALALWFTPAQFTALLFYMSIFGALLCFALLLQKYLPSSAQMLDVTGAPTKLKRKQRIPYGVAITAGGLIPTSQLILNALMA